MGEKHRIGILSLYYKNRNYGGLLQAYALQKCIDSYGIACEQICFHNVFQEKDGYLTDIKKRKGIKKGKAVLRYCKYQGSQMIVHVMGVIQRRKIERRICAFSSFQEEIPHSEEIYTKETISLASEKYAAVICGSDVIWNAGISPYISCLGFVSEKARKVAYAPSLGKDILPVGWLEAYSPYLKRLDAVSVREESIRERIKENIPDLRIETVIDPVFLLRREEWEKQIKETDDKGEYIFCYLLGSSKVQRRYIKKWAVKERLRVITFPYIEHNLYRTCDLGFGDEKIYDLDPLQFVSLIKNAEIVVTDSFHAVAFSLIFHKNFRALRRLNGKAQTGLSGRIQNLLKEMRMEQYLINDESIMEVRKTEYPDFFYYEEIIAKKREESRNYLLKNL